jgi:PGF-pre-PGF domain-containing protein
MKRGMKGKNSALFLIILTILVIFTSNLVLAWGARTELTNVGQVNITSLRIYGAYSTSINVTVQTTLVNSSVIADSNFNVTLFCNKSGGSVTQTTTGADLVKIITLYNGTNGNISAGTGYAILSNRTVWINNIILPVDESTRFNCSLYAENTTNWAWSYGNGAMSLNLSNLTFDSTPPNVSTTLLAHVNNGNYSGLLGVLAKANDIVIGMSSLFLNFSYANGSYANFSRADTTSSGTGSNNFLGWIETRFFPDGRYNLTIYANDTLNNMNTSISFSFIFDNTAPTGSISCTPASLYKGDTITCNCVSSDATAGVNGTYITASTALTGTITPYCTITDYAGNSFVASGTPYTVLAKITTPSTSSPGSSSTTPPSNTSTSSQNVTVTKSQNFTAVAPSAPAVVTGFGSSTGVSEIKIGVNQTASNVQVIINKYELKPSSIAVSKNDTYKYLHIETVNLENLSNATMKVQVEKSWVSSKNLSKEDVALFRYDEATDKWNELPTVFSSEDSTYYYYTAELTHFSYFAIASSKLLVEAEPALPVWVWVIVGLVVIVVIISGGLVLKNKKK